MAYKSKYTGLQIDDILDSVGSKQNEIEDLDQIRAGAEKGATALQSYTEKYTGTVTGIKMNGLSKGTEGIIDLGTVITAHQDISGKQDKLVSGTNIKTINGESILGEGDLTVEGGAKVYTWNWDGTMTGTLTQEEYDGIKEADVLVVSMLGVTSYPAHLLRESEQSMAALIQLDNVVVEFTFTKEGDATRFTRMHKLIKTSQLENDSNFVSSDGLKTINGESIVGSGDITISSSSSGGSGAYSEVNHGTADTTFTLTPNTFHVWDEVASLTLDFGSETSGVANEFLFQFTSGSTATSLTLPDDIKWANDSAPTIEPNMIYQVSILKGLASVLEFNAISSVMPITLNVTRWAITESSVNPKAAKLYKELMDISQGTGNGTLDEGMLQLYIVNEEGNYLRTENVTSFSKSTAASVPGILLWNYNFIDHILQEDGTIAVYDWD